MPHFQLGAILFGLSINEWLGIFALAGTVLGTSFSLLKQVVVKPIVKELKQLTATTDNINVRVENHEKRSAEERQAIHNRVNKVNVKVEVLETEMKYVKKDIDTIKNEER